MTLDALFAPRRLAIVGMNAPGAPSGEALVRRCLAAGFPGELIPVDPRGGEIAGLTCARSVSDLQPGLDLVVLCVAPRDVARAAEDWAALGARSLLVTADPRGDLGDRHDGLLGRLCETWPLRVVGPASLGVAAPGRGLHALAAEVPLRAGGVALAARAGDRLTAVLTEADRRGLGFHEILEVGDGADVDLPELLDRWGVADEVGVIALFAARYGDPAAFVAAVRRASRAKPVLVLGPDRAELASLGAIPVETPGELAALAGLFDGRPPLPRGGRVAVVARARALGELAAASLAGAGLTLARPSDATLGRLRGEVHPHAQLTPFVDLLPVASARHVELARAALAADEAVDAVLEAVAGDAAPRVVEAPGGVGGPIVAASPEEGARAVAALLRFARARAAPPPEEAPLLPDARPQLAQAILVAAHITRRDRLDADEARRALEAYGVPSLRATTVGGAPGARRAADALGYPVTLVMRAGTTVRRAAGLRDGRAVEEAVIELYEAGQGLAPMITFEVLEAPAAAAELALEVGHHPHLGHTLRLLGGGRRSKAMLPIGPAAAATLAQEALVGVPEASAEALADVVLRVARLIADLPDIHTLSIAPLRAIGERWLAAEVTVAWDLGQEPVASR